MKPKKKDWSVKKEEHDASKKPYSAPQLTIHGTVEEITEAIAGAPNDAITAGSLIA